MSYLEMSSLPEAVNRRPLFYAIAAGVFAVGVAAGFYCGFAYRGALLPAPAAATQAAAPAAAAPRFGFGGRPVVAGRVVSVSGNTIVVHDNATDTDVKVTLAPGVTVTRSQTVTVKPSSLKTTDTVVVSGLAQADGSVQATGVAVGVGGGGGGGPRVVRPQPTAS